MKGAELSRFLAYALRHHPDAIGVSLDRAGWVDVDLLLAALARHGRTVERVELERLVGAPGKQRFEIVDGRIRAAQGHSVDVDLELAPVTPPALLFHGTVERSLPSIERQGLLPMGRRHVHLSGDRPTARIVGARRGQPVILRVDAAAAHAAGHPFLLATNGVWLTDQVPPKYLSREPGGTALSGSLPAPSG